MSNFFTTASPDVWTAKTNLVEIPLGGSQTNYWDDDAVTQARTALLDINQWVRGFVDNWYAMKDLAGDPLPSGLGAGRSYIYGTASDLKWKTSAGVVRTIASGTSSFFDTAGTGLTSAGSTVNVGAGAGISVAADAVALDLTYAPTWTGIHTHSARPVFNAGATVGASQTLTVGANTLIGTVADKLNPVHIAHASQATGDLLYADSATTMTRLASATGVLTAAGAAPSWSATLGVALGGTGLASYTVGDILYASAATTIAKLASAAAGSVLTAGGAGVAPAYLTAFKATSSQVSFLSGGSLPGTAALIEASTTAADARVYIRSANTSGYGGIAGLNNSDYQIVAACFGDGHGGNRNGIALANSAQIYSTGAAPVPMAIGPLGAAALTLASNNTARVTVDSIARTKMTASSFQLVKGADVASANDCVLLIDGDLFHVTGTTTINGFPGSTHASAPRQAGSVVYLIFDGVLTLKHNTAPSATFAKVITKSAADITTAANYTITLAYDGASWFEI